MKDQNRKNKFLFCKIALLAVFLLFFSSAGAMPFVIRSVDGSWLPMIAQSWVSKNGGVLVKLADGIKPNALRKEMLSKITDLSVEVLGKDLFFPTTTPDSLFEMLKNIDIDVSGITAKRQTTYDSSEMFVKKSAESTVPKDEYIEALVEDSVFDGQNKKVIVSVKIQQRAKNGAFTKLYGKYRIEHVYNMKDGVIDPADAENVTFIHLLMLKKGSKISFVPTKLDSRVLTIMPDFKIK